MTSSVRPVNRKLVTFSVQWPFRFWKHCRTIWREISVSRYFISLSWISTISRDLLAFIILSPIYRDILAVKCESVLSTCCAVKLLKMFQIFMRGSYPSQKVLPVVGQLLGQVCPWLHNLHKKYINSNSSQKHNF